MPSHARRNMDEYSHAFRNDVILHLLNHIMYKIITFRKPTLLTSSGEGEIQMHLLYRTAQKKLVLDTGQSSCLRWSKYAPETKSIYSLRTTPDVKCIFWPADMTGVREIGSCYGFTIRTAFSPFFRLRKEALAAHISSDLPKLQDSLSATYSRFTQTLDP
jgi:hypothetical protein